MARIFLTGATGFIGRRLATVLRARGHSVTALVRSPGGLQRAKEHGLEPVLLERPDADSLERSLAGGYDAVFHLAAFIPPDQRDPSHAVRCLETNALLTLELLRASAKAGVGRFVYFMTGNAYAPASDEPAAEIEPLQPAAEAVFYLGSKILGEVYVEHFRECRQLHTISLRLSSVYGPGMPATSVVMRFVENALAGRPLQVLKPPHRADMVFVDDVVEAGLSALVGGPPGIYNVGSGTATTVAELARLVLEVFKRDAPIEMSPQGSELHQGFRPLDISKIQSAWGWRPRSLQAGLESLRSEMQKEGAVAARAERRGQL